jgi:phospholipid/cholesterol/gamma-HCH transport system substrate-binding protein
MSADRAPQVHERGLTVREQIERYRTAFIAIVSMIVIALAIAGYILAHENFKLPGWVPVLGHDHYTLRAEFQTAQAVTPGQGQAVTIAGAKIGEIASVDLHQGVATVTMNITPKYARLYRNATLLLRPKTQLQDITVEVNPGDPSAGRLKSGQTLPLSQTAPNVNFDEFLAGLDAETRSYLQELLAAAGQGLKGNAASLSAALKRLEPAARYGHEITQQLQLRHANIAHSIHDLRLLVEALGGKDTQIAQFVDAANAEFATFAKEEANLQRTLHLLPGALRKTGSGLGKLAVASSKAGPTLRALDPFAKALGPANEATRRLARETTPVIRSEIRPFAREILPVVNELAPSTKRFATALPKLSVSFSVLNEFFNELAYNPGPSKGGFLFFLDWGNHNLNSVVSSADAHGPLGRTLVYFNCQVVNLFKGASAVNPTVNLLVGLLRPPTKQECVNLKLLSPSGLAITASERGSSRAPTGAGLFSGLSQNPFTARAAGRSRPRAKAAKAGRR